MTFSPQILVSAAFALLALAVPGSAAAQSESEFQTAFSGTWQAMDARRGNGGICSVGLTARPSPGGLEAQPDNCAAPLDTIASWSIIDGQMALASSTGDVIARLGGNQRRMTGDLADGSHIIIERDGGDGSAARLQSALTASGCFYLGYTDRCAEVGADSLPQMSDGGGSVKVLVDLNARSEARPDAPVLGTVPRGTCLAVTECTAASDGPWCRAAFSGGEQGWVRKLALRQDRWAVITFENRC